MLESGHFPRDRTSKNIKRYYESATDVKLLKRIVYNCKKKRAAGGWFYYRDVLAI